MFGITLFFILDVPGLPQFVEDECYEYNDDVDQLFILAEGLIESSKQRTQVNQKNIPTISIFHFF